MIADSHDVEPGISWNLPVWLTRTSACTSDCQFCQHYRSSEFSHGLHGYRKRLRQHGMLCSMSRKGDCWDNTPMESFYATLKGELTDRCDYLTRDEARADVFQFLEGWYNKRGLHSALGYVTPEQAVARFQAAASAA